MSILVHLKSSPYTWGYRRWTYGPIISQTRTLAWNWNIWKGMIRSRCYWRWWWVPCNSTIFIYLSISLDTFSHVSAFIFFIAVFIDSKRFSSLKYCILYWLLIINGKFYILLISLNAASHSINLVSWRLVPASRA